MSKKSDAKSAKPSSNWLALQKSLSSSSSSKQLHARKKRKLEHSSTSPISGTTKLSVDDVDFIRGPQPSQPIASSSKTVPVAGPSIKNGESLAALRQMVAGDLSYSESQRESGKFLAIDCEMVGVGIDGKESSLARVSIVNYHGAVQMDEFVRQRERVVDYRTEYSGIRPSDMVKAKPFNEIQQQVAELIKDRILVGHAIHNDLKVLLLSHPRHLIRDTQALAGKHKVMKTRRPALRMLVKQEVGVIIQEGEHSSVTDARATMAVYRLHRKEWDKGVSLPPGVTASSSSKKRKAPSSVVEAEDDDENDEDEDEGHNQGGDRAGKRKTQGSGEGPIYLKKKKSIPTKDQVFPGGGRKGVSSGLSTVIKRRDGSALGRNDSTQPKGAEKKTAWWKELGGGSSDGAKGGMSMKLKAG